jgi:phosphohistidine phosphatase
MKTLILVRHAKSSWNHPGLADFDRPLNQRGERDAPGIGVRLAVAIETLDAIVASPALRARQTALTLAGGIGFPEAEIRFEGGLYGASAAEMTASVRCFDNDAQIVAMVGHNPGMTDLANRFTGRYIDNIPTAGVVVIAFDIDAWNECIDRGGSLVSYDYPKKHRHE